MSESVTEQIRRVLNEHPLVAEKGFYAGVVICDSCHTCLGDPAQHLLKFLAPVLDPFYTPPEQAPKVSGRVRDPRESRIGWED